MIKRSEEQFWIEFQTFQVHGIDTRILQKVFSRFLSIAPDKRLDFEQNRYPRLHIWIQKETKETHFAMNRCIFSNNAK